tara:strand:- start:6556 stop:8532 length:1977 start_codon:yes stop_codon:yes gene_type:complete
MCGFTGFLDPHHSFGPGMARSRLRAMTDAIRHRGPDAEGISVEETASGAAWAGLGHRRLSILDLSAAGAQPMESKCGRYLIGYNGEIYNFQSLRAELEERSAVSWQGHSDTEVLLEGIARDGVEATLRRLDGMFAFALIDRATKTLTLARDAFGEKPLVYGIWGGVLLFGSELQALRSWPGFAPEEDTEARASLIQYSYIPAPATIYQGIRKLPPAHMVEISMDVVKRGALPAPVPWWDMAGSALSAQQNPFEGDFKAAVDALEGAFDRSVAQRMVSDVPLGVLLSGGIDSTLTAAFMQRVSGVPVRSFTIGMAEEGYDESPHAEAVARHLGTRHETFMLTPSEVLKEVPNIAAHYDEPFADSSQLPTFLVSRMARDHVTVALSGDGGDELFAGYNRHFQGPRLWAHMQRLPVGLRSVVGSGLGAVPPAVLTALVRFAGPLAPQDLAAGRAGEKLHKLARLLGSRDRAEFQDALLRTGHSDAILASGAHAQVLTEGVDPRTDNLDLASAMMLFDTGHYLHDDILTKVDRASMAVGLETRTPFLNRELFNLAWRLPHSFKAEGAEGKRVLRALLYRHVPREIVDRPKAGFTMPIGRWLRGPLADWAESLLSTDAIARTDVFNTAAVRKIWNEHRAGQQNHETVLWTVLMYQTWRESVVR